MTRAHIILVLIDLCEWAERIETNINRRIGWIVCPRRY